MSLLICPYSTIYSQSFCGPYNCTIASNTEPPRCPNDRLAKPISLGRRTLGRPRPPDHPLRPQRLLQNRLQHLLLQGRQVGLPVHPEFLLLRRSGNVVVLQHDGHHRGGRHRRLQGAPRDDGGHSRGRGRHHF